MPDPTAADARVFNARVNRLIREAIGAEGDQIKGVLKELSDFQVEFRATVAGAPGGVFAQQIATVDARLDVLRSVLDGLADEALRDQAARGAGLIEDPFRKIGRVVAPGASLDVTDTVHLARAALRAHVDEMRAKTVALLGRVHTGGDPASVLRAVGTRLQGSELAGKAASDSATTMRYHAGRVRHEAMLARATDAETQGHGEVRKTWVHGHSRDSRHYHVTLARRYGPGGDPGPIPVDWKFRVGPYRTDYPRGPGLSSRDTLGCHCTMAVLLTTTPGG